jgi:SNF2 family DNA or RNA helicase
VTIQLMRAEQWQPPPQPAVFGELAADGTRVVLAVTGDDFELRAAAAQLLHITPLVTVDYDGYRRKTGLLYIPCTWAAVTQVAWTFTGTGGRARWLPGPRLRAWITAELTRRTSRPDPATYPVLPPGLAARGYQVDGAAMIAQMRKFLLFDDPGLGKTITALVGLLWLQRLGTAIFPLVIITPSWDVCSVWEREIAAWAPAWRTARWKGPERAQLPASGPDPGLTAYTTTYATATLDAPAGGRGPLQKLGPAAVVIDEGHFCKNPEAKRFLATARIASRAAVVIELTGTPVTQDTGDAWALMHIADPESWAAKKRFTKRFCDTGDDEYGEKIEGLNALRAPEFWACLTGAQRRVAKADVLRELPPKIYSVRNVELPPEWRKAYDGMAEDMLAELPDGQVLPVMDLIAQSTFLAQLASAAADVEITEEADELTGTVRKHYHAILKAPSWKADALLGIMAERPGKPVAAFAPSRQLVTLAGQLAEKEGYKVGYVTGIGQGVTNRTRTKAIADFQAGRLDLICVSTKAGGTGITLTAAGTGVFLQRPWPLDESIQAENRLHRIGSEIHEHGVEIIDIVADDTIESRVRARLREKGGHLAEYLRDERIVRELFGGLK